MKTLKFIAIACIALVITSCDTKNSEENKVASSSTVNGVSSATFKVWGNCEMCKETIEGSLKVDGITKADWNVDTKIMSVNFDSTKISLDKIKKNIAIVGYDNEKFKADDKVYSELPECCQYDRK